MQIVIIGGGMVGAAAALSLAQAGHQITLVERDRAPQQTNDGDWDLRISSIHHGNLNWLAQLNVLSAIPATRYYDYQQLSVTTADGAELSFHSDELGIVQLGAMIENRALQAALWQRLSEQPQLRLLSSAAVDSIDRRQQRVHLADGESLPYQLLLGADGHNSMVARAAGIGYRGWDYGQRCLLATVRCQQPLAPHTWEVFRQQGPYAILPLGERLACLIDYRSQVEWQPLLEQGREAVASELHHTFHERVGAFELLHHASFAIARWRALQYFQQNIALLGDAAHSIHPLAGQGVNLGFADVRSLTKALQQPSLDTALADYQRQRMRQNQQMMRAMDACHVGFRSEQWGVSLLRRAGLATLQRVPLLKQQVLRYAVGLA
ncbi:FAD-dependent oxidoreductase [Idiomarina xiamenensis]|uniref:UbiH/Coq6 family FAD-binding oxidoreductase n=1 Tax=Idiomarina xiamenensis 10-D-4 TaxID=740709 RepID=K2K5E6_9GAMM|nr:FAD-dependent oxidoreductase [Idiomarina xiamenensis]EKE82793.1 UbiH/Coq6 family FAD-binding oxidoreductase [Idiomarina xiamenensis 10-D-4]